MKINREGLERILEAQKELDKAILKEAGIKEYPLDDITIAYNVELGELCQEWKGFKYWKKTKGEVNREALIEEYADCLHFASSLTNYYIANSDGAKRFFEAFMLTLDEEIEEDKNFVRTRLLKCFDGDRYFNYGAILLIDTLKLGAELGFSWEEIEEAYFKKNNINWERLAGGY